MTSLRFLVPSQNNCVPVCSLICPNGPTRFTLGGFFQIFMDFYRNLRTKFSLILKAMKTDTVHEDVHKYMILPYRIIFRLTKSFNGSCTKKSKLISYLMHFLLKILPFAGYVQEIRHSQRGRSEHNMTPHDTIYVLDS